MVNDDLAGFFGAGTGFTTGLLAAMPPAAPLRTVPNSKIRGRIIVEN
jgi:hypothetical protein